MIGYILTKAFQVRQVEATPLPDRPAYCRVGKKLIRHDEVYPSFGAAVRAGEATLARLRAEFDRRDAELTRRAGYLKVARAGMRQGD